MKHHLAIFTQPFLDLLLDGEKTIESRFSKVRCAPYGQITEGDLVFCKESGGPVRGQFIAGPVLSFHNVDDRKMREIAAQYGTAICANADLNFWRDRWGKSYVTLIAVTAPTRYRLPKQVHKRDRRGWVPMNRSRPLFREQL